MIFCQIFYSITLSAYARVKSLSTADLIIFNISIMVYTLLLYLVLLMHESHSSSKSYNAFLGSTSPRLMYLLKYHGSEL